MDEYIKGIEQGDEVWYYLPKTNTYLPKDISPFLAASIDRVRILDEKKAQHERAIQHLTEENKKAVERKAVLDKQQADNRFQRWADNTDDGYDELVN